MTRYRSLLSKEAQHRMAEKDKYYEKRLIEFRNLTTKNLISSVKYYLTQMKEPRKYSPTDPVYDAVFHYIIIPELLRRLEKYE